MADDMLRKAAAQLTDTEAQILAMYARGFSSGDISINLEVSRGDVVHVIRDKGHDNRAYCDNVTKARAGASGTARASAVLASRNPMPSGRPSMAKDFMAAPVRSAPARAAIRHDEPPARKPAQKAAPVVTAPKTGRINMDIPSTETRVRTVDEPRAPAASTEVAPVAAAAVDPEPVVVAEPEPEPLPEPAEVAPTPAPDPVRAGEESYEQLLTRAEGCTNADLKSVAEGLRFELERLTQALEFEARAVVLREKIGVLDADIADRVSRRDALRAELDRLMNSAVMVSAASGLLRRPAPAGEPDNAHVRAWARKHDYEIAEAGKIPFRIVSAYKKAFGYPA